MVGSADAMDLDGGSRPLRQLARRIYYLQFTSDSLPPANPSSTLTTADATFALPVMNIRRGRSHVFFRVEGRGRKRSRGWASQTSSEAYFRAACLAHAIRARHSIPCASFPGQCSYSCALAMQNRHRDSEPAQPTHLALASQPRREDLGEPPSLALLAASSSQKKLTRPLRLLGPSGEQGWPMATLQKTGSWPATRYCTPTPTLCSDGESLVCDVRPNGQPSQIIQLDHLTNPHGSAAESAVCAPRTSAVARRIPYTFQLRQ